LFLVDRFLSRLILLRKVFAPLLKPIKESILLWVHLSILF